MNKQQIIDTFTKQLLEFAKCLCKLYPYDPDLKLAKTAVVAISLVNSRQLLDLYNDFAYPYREKILNKDEDYFLQKDFVSEDLNASNDKSAFSTMFNFRRYLTDLSYENKENVWLYMKVLVKLNDKYLELR